MDKRMVQAGLFCIAISVPLLAFVGCSDDAQSNVQTSAPATSAAITTTGDGDTVSVTIPAAFFEGGWEADPEAVLDDYHCTDVVMNDDGSRTVNLTKANYSALVEQAYADAQKAIKNLAEDDAYPHVTSVDFDEQFGTVTMTLDTNDLSAVKTGLPYIPGSIACGYQLMAGLPVACDVILVSPDGADLLETQFPVAEAPEE